MMRIIQTYCTFEGEPARMNAGFPTLRMFLIWFKKSYIKHSRFDYMLYTDKHGYEVIKDIVKPEHVTVIEFPYVNDYIPYISKFQVQELQDKPFIHVDLDAILHEPPLREKADIITEMWRPVGFGREIESLGLDEIVYNYAKQPDGSMSVTRKFNKIICSGLLGFNDMEFHKRYLKKVWQMIDHVKKYRIRADFEICYTIEETTLTAMAIKENKTVKALCGCSYIHLQGKNKIF